MICVNTALGTAADNDSDTSSDRHTVTHNDSDTSSDTHSVTQIQ